MLSTQLIRLLRLGLVKTRFKVILAPIELKELPLSKINADNHKSP